MIKVYYRISDNNNKTGRPEYFTNENCLNNFLNNFNPDEIFIIADNVSDKTYQWINSLQVDNIRTNLGNSRSFEYALNRSLYNDDDDIIYFVENDYIHSKNSKDILTDGFKFNVDYVTLYDHPDKYNTHYNINYKKEICFFEKRCGYGFLQSKIYCGDKCYWRTTPSTCMTFASKVKTLKNDYDIIISFLKDKNENYFSIPLDFLLFLSLMEKGRILISPMPGAATHGDMLSPFVDWQSEI